MSEEYIDTFYARTLDERVEYPTLKGAIDADVCVIGGGLAGLNTALGLAERGKKAVLLEQNRIGWGASGRNAGFVAKGYAAGEASLAKKLGLEKAQGLVTLTKNARQLIKKRIKDFNIDCGPVIDGVLTVSWRDRAEELKRYINKANDDFSLGFEFWPKEKVREVCNTKKYFDGIFSPHDFQFNPLRYVRGIAKAFVQQGGSIFEESEALKITREGKGWRVETAQGTVHAQHVVLCCALYFDGLDRRLEYAAIPVQTYIMATAPIDEEVLKSAIDTKYAIYDTRFCSDYYRILPGNRLLWGGRVGLWAHPKDISEAMLHDMFKLYPQLKGHVRPEVSWSGILCYPPHKMPQIGQFEPGYWYNTGFGGHGLCPTTAGGEVVAAAIAEGDDAYKRFAPFKPYFTGGRIGRFGAQAVYGWWRLRDILDV